MKKLNRRDFLNHLAAGYQLHTERYGRGGISRVHRRLIHPEHGLAPGQIPQEMVDKFARAALISTPRPHAKEQIWSITERGKAIAAPEPTGEVATA